jgi:hypothetical protein
VKDSISHLREYQDDDIVLFAERQPDFPSDNNHNHTPIHLLDDMDGIVMLKL